MPEYPDIVVYIERLRALVNGTKLEQIRISNPFLLRTANPALESIFGKKVEGIERMGKRMVFSLSGEYYLVLHLMISGRLQWHKRGQKIPGKRGLAALDFSTGCLIVTEASTKKRASLHLFSNAADMQQLNRGGLEVLEADPDEFRVRILARNHTLKRALTDPRILSGIGNAYSDEILHHAGLSPILLTSKLTPDQVTKLYHSIRHVLKMWSERLRDEVGEGFPKKVTAFRDDMSVHGKYGKPCPECGAIVQRIKYASNETNYCPRCQTDGRILADRALSRLLKQDWPRTQEELEEHIELRKRMVE